MSTPSLSSRSWDAAQIQFYQNEFILNKAEFLDVSLFKTQGRSIYHLRKIFRKTNISYPLIGTRKCEYQGVRNLSSLENFAYVLNGYSIRYSWTS